MPGATRWHEVRSRPSKMPTLGFLGLSRARGSWCVIGALAAAVSCSESPDSKPSKHGSPGDAGEAEHPEAGASGDSQPPGSTGGTGGARPTPSGGAGSGGAASLSGGSPPTDETPAGGSVRGSASAGASAGTGTGGTPPLSVGGAGGDDAGGAAGDAGIGGPSAAGEACLACGAGACGASLRACEQNPECGPWLDCVMACDGAACSRACDARYSGLSRVYYGIYSCLCGSCSAECQVTESCQKSCDADPVLAPSDALPASLADTGLYAKNGSISPLARSYDVRFPLWADGAGKGRYVYVPPCATIDTSDMDHWKFPVGTRFWKEFGEDGQLIETRLLHRYGSGEDDWLYATYGWDTAHPGDPSAARLVEKGQSNAGGTLHDIPDLSACATCHGKLPDRVLGFSAIQLSHAEPGLNMQKLSDWGWLSLPARSGFKVPGTAVQQAALGYLHGNCGGCHNQQVDIPREDPMRLRLLVGQTDYATTDAVRTTIGVPTVSSYPELHGKPRVAPGAPENSAVFLRMSDRNKFPMPPLATKFSDVDGGDADVEAWIDSL